MGLHIQVMGEEKPNAFKLCTALHVNRAPSHWHTARTPAGGAVRLQIGKTSC